MLTPLHYAATSGNVAIAEILVNNGAVIDAKDGFEMTSLHKAACADHKDMMKYLINIYKYSALRGFIAFASV